MAFRGRGHVEREDVGILRQVGGAKEQEGAVDAYYRRGEGADSDKRGGG